VPMEKQRQICKEKKVKIEKNIKKEDVLLSLGKALYGAKNDVIKYNNLKLIS